MSSSLFSLMEVAHMSDYTATAVISAVVYDYILTFSSEVEYVWCTHWTWVSTMFVFVRYLGLCWSIINALAGSTFMLGTVKVYVCQFEARKLQNTYRNTKGTAIYLVFVWSFVIFITVADLMMVLRVYSMWNRSKTILRFLLCVYTVQTAGCFVYAAMYINPAAKLIVRIAELPGFLNPSSCWFALDVPPKITICFMIPRFVLSAVLLILALAQTIKQSIEMYNATKQWRANRYMEVLAREGIIYFFTSLLYNTTETVLSLANFLSDDFFLIIPVCFVYVLFATIMPRFIISVREFHTLDLQARWEGMDSRFGVVSQPVADQNGAFPHMSLADVGGHLQAITESESGESEATRLEESRDGAPQV